MKKIIKLTENDLIRLVKRVIKEGTSDCLKDFKISSGKYFRGDYKYAENGEGIKIHWDFENNDWLNRYEKLLPNTRIEIGKWRCENGKFITYDSSIKTRTMD